MPLQAGPFMQQAQTAMPFTAGAYNFVGESATDLSELDSIGATLDGFLVDMEAYASEDETLIITENLGVLVFDVLSAAASVFLPSLDKVSLSMGAADKQYTDAFTFAPPAAWTDPPGPFVPPDSGQAIAAPSIPFGAYNPTAQVPVGRFPDQPGNSVSLFNTTRLGQPNFVVGDGFLILAQGPVGSDVTVHAWFNEQDHGEADYGPIGLGGGLNITGTMTPDVVGVWREDWYVAGSFVGTVNFLVLLS